MAKKSALHSQIAKEKVEASTEQGSALAKQVERCVETKASAAKSSKLKKYVMDLRVHSPESLNYFGLEGIDTAPAMVSLAKVKGLDMIAVTDFYSARFVDRVVAAAKDTPVTIIPGVDIRCIVGACDDVVLTCLFPEDFSSNSIENFLSDLEIPSSAQGNANYLLRKPFERVLEVLELHGGVAIPSRIDMTPHRLSALPILVEKYGFRAFDLAYPETAQFLKRRFPKIKFQALTFSSANSLAQVGSRTAKVKMPIGGFAGVRDLVSRAP